MRRSAALALAAAALAALLAGCDNRGNGASVTTNDVQLGPTVGPSITVSPEPRTNRPTEHAGSPDDTSH